MLEISKGKVFFVQSTFKKLTTKTISCQTVSDQLYAITSIYLMCHISLNFDKTVYIDEKFEWKSVWPQPDYLNYQFQLYNIKITQPTHSKNNTHLTSNQQINQTKLFTHLTIQINNKTQRNHGTEHTRHPDFHK